MSAQLDAVILTTLPSIILLLCSSQYSPGSGSFLLLLFFDHHFHFPAQLVGGFALSDLLDKPVVTGVVPSPRYVPSIFIAHRVQHSHCSSIFIECCSLTLSRFPLINFLCGKKSIRVCALDHAGNYGCGKATETAFTEKASTI